MKNLAATALCLLALAAPASAAITATPGQLRQEAHIPYDDPGVFHQTIVDFDVDSDVDLYVQLMAFPDNPWAQSTTGYVLDVDYSPDDGTTWQPWVDDKSGTAASNAISILGNDTHSLRFTWHYPDPTAGVRYTGGVVIAHEATNTTNGTGSGGVQDPSVGHVVEYYFYDVTTDSDHDGLHDSCEIRYWGNLSELPSNDPDGDGFDNDEECAAGSDPTDVHSRPEEPIYRAGSGGSISDREIGLMVVALIIVALAAFVGAWILKNDQQERTFITVTGGVGFGVLAGLFLLAALDHLSLGQGWAFWQGANLTWQQWTATGLAVASILAIGAASLSFTQQSKESRPAMAVLAVAVVIVVAGILLFGVLDVPFPWGG